MIKFGFIHCKYYNCFQVHLTPIPQTNFESTLRVINAADCNLVVNSDVYPDWLTKSNNQTFAEGGLNLKPGEVSERPLIDFEYQTMSHHIRL